MILLEPLIESIKKELGSNFFTEAHGETDAYRYIDSAVNYVWNYRDWTWNKDVYTFIYGTALTEVTIPYMIKIFGVKFNNEPQTILDSQGWFFEKDFENKVGIYGDKFISQNTGTYQILHTSVSPIIQVGDTQLNIPDVFKDVIRILAVSFGYRDVKKYDKSSPLIGEANALLENLANRTSVPMPTEVIRLGSNTSWK